MHTTVTRPVSAVHARMDRSGEPARHARARRGEARADAACATLTASLRVGRADVARLEAATIGSGEDDRNILFPRAQRDGGKASYAPALATPKTNRSRTAVRPRRPPRPPAPAA